MSYTPEQIIYARRTMMERAGWIVEQTGEAEWRVTTPTHCQLYANEEFARESTPNPFTNANALDAVVAALSVLELLSYWRQLLHEVGVLEKWSDGEFAIAFTHALPVQTRAECAARAMGMLPEVKA